MRVKYILFKSLTIACLITFIFVRYSGGMLRHCQRLLFVMSFLGQVIETQINFSKKEIY